MWKCRGVLRHAAGGASVILENDGGKRGGHTVGMLHNRGDRIVRQFLVQRGFPIIVIPVGKGWAQQRLHRWKRHGLDSVKNWLAELAQRLEKALALGGISAVAGDHAG